MLIQFFQFSMEPKPDENRKPKISFNENAEVIEKQVPILPIHNLIFDTYFYTHFGGGPGGGKCINF
jgi:hypothetical protein